MSGHPASEFRVRHTYLAFALVNTSPEDSSPVELFPQGAVEITTNQAVQFPRTGEAWLDTHMSASRPESDDPVIRLVVRAVVAVPAVEGEASDDLRSRVETAAARSCRQKALDELHHLMAAMNVGVPGLSVDVPSPSEGN